METASDRKKIEAIYQLREAVETKVRAEAELAANGTESARDALLVSQLDVEAKTQDAIDACHECGEVHSPDGNHAVTSRISERRDNVIVVDFGSSAESA